LEAYWQDGQDIGDVAVLQAIAVEVGLDGGDFMPALSNPTHEQAVLQDVQQAHQYGLNGVPALIFANKYLVSGAQPYETLVQVVEQVTAELGN
jgi:predicted DsbA family dithiol-disulfide isomerase